MKTPTLIGTIIFMISLLITALAAIELSFFFPEFSEPYFELFFIWIAGVVGGLGLGYGNRESYGYSEGNNATIIGGLGLAGTMALAVWMLVQGSTPLPGVVMAFIGAILAIVGLYMIVVSTQESY
ncbi:MAG: hypothetical protein ACFFAU_15095 [Candidatus Hodarchaeota archaeon]